MPSIDDAAEATGGAVGVYAGCPQHFELHTAPDRVAGREDVSDSIAYDAGADNGEPASVLKKSRCRANAQPKLADSASNAPTIQIGLREDKRGHAPSTLARLRQDDVKGDPGDADDERSADQALGREGASEPPAAPPGYRASRSEVGGKSSPAKAVPDWYGRRSDARPTWRSSVRDGLGAAPPWSTLARPGPGSAPPSTTAPFAVGPLTRWHGRPTQCLRWAGSPSRP